MNVLRYEPGPGASATPVGKVRALLRAVALALVVLGVVTARVVAAGEAELSASTEALRQGDAREATVRARRAAGWYAPGAPHVTVAYTRLTAIARAAEEHREPAIALFAWRSIRTAALETRWLVTPHARDLDEANRAIARLESQGVGDARAANEQRLRDLHTRDESPRLLWVIALLAGFGATAGGLFAMARRGAAPGRVDWTRTRTGALVALAGVALWLIALWRA